MKNALLNSRIWGLNICCGKTDGKGINADIFKHAEIKNFVMLDNIYQLPFGDKQFDSVLCSHTIEHVEEPDVFFRELSRVGKHVTIVLPPLWDITAAFNLLEHRWVFLSFRKVHSTLPKRVYLPFADLIKILNGTGYIKA